MDDGKYIFKLIGGACDGEEGQHDMSESGGGIVDNMLFAHPEIPTLCIHYRLESILADDDGDIDTIEYIFTKEFNSADAEEYMEQYVSPIGGPHGD